MVSPRMNQLNSNHLLLTRMIFGLALDGMYPIGMVQEYIIQSQLLPYFHPLVNKIWGSSSNNLFIVGTDGNMDFLQRHKLAEDRKQHNVKHKRHLGRL